MPIPGVIASSISGHLQTGNFFLIQQLSPSAVSTVTFSSIPSTYKHLMMRFNLVNSYSGDTYRIQFNSDTSTANYVTHTLYGNGSTVGAAGAASGTFGFIRLFYSSSVITTYPNIGIVDVFDYTNTNKNKTVKALVGANNNSSTGEIEVDSGVWLSTAAVTSLTFSAITGPLTGTISLYGSN